MQDEVRHRAGDDRRSRRSVLDAVNAVLTREFAGTVSSETVSGCVARTYEQLLNAGVRAGLGAALEGRARTQLQALTPARVYPRLEIP